MDAPNQWPKNISGINEQNMVGKGKFSFPINGLHDVIKSKDSTIKIDDVVFHYRGNIERVGTVITEVSTIEAAEKDSRYLINRSLGKICFAFNTEACISPEGFYYVDLINNPNLEKIIKSLGIRYSYVKEDPNSILTKEFH